MVFKQSIHQFLKHQSGGGERERIVDQGGENGGSERLGWTLGPDYSHLDYFDRWAVLFSYCMYQYLLRICSNSLKLRLSLCSDESIVGGIAAVLHFVFELHQGLPKLPIHSRQVYSLQASVFSSPF